MPFQGLVDNQCRSPCHCAVAKLGRVAAMEEGV
jgi:hypothetical protein